MESLAQDPDELFDVVNEDGSPTGRTKRRADVHRDGDWHRAVHVWIYGIDDTGPYLLLNQRGRNKDTWPLALDATVGGHLGAGETVEDAFREIEEEVGISPNPEDLYHLGRRARASNGDLPGIIDRELQEIYLLADSRPFMEFRPNPAELEGLVRISLGSALGLFSGEITTARGTRLRASDRGFDWITIHTDDLLIRGGDDYFLSVARAIHRLVQGEKDVCLPKRRPV
jgi:isopentenyldiphosphate isomerase